MDTCTEGSGSVSSAIQLLLEITFKNSNVLNKRSNSHSPLPLGVYGKKSSLEFFQ